MVHDVINNHGVFHHHGDINHQSTMVTSSNMVTSYTLKTLITMLTSTTFVLITNSILLTTLVLPNTDYPLGLRAESARAVTGRQSVAMGEDFWPRRPVFFYESGRHSETKSRKNWSQGAKWTVFPNAMNGPVGSYDILKKKNGFLGLNPSFWAKKNPIHFLVLTMFWPRPEKVVQRKKYPFLKKFWVFFLCYNAFLAKKNTFRLNVKTANSP